MLRPSARSSGRRWHYLVRDERQVRRKVGMTAEVVQHQFGFHEPVFGCLMEDGVRHSRHLFAADELIRQSFETEVCVRLGVASGGL